MAQREIVWTRTADIQFVGILEYWLKRNESNTYSKKLIARVSKITRQISAKPHIFKLTGFKETRMAAMGNYNIFYQATDERIIITAFWDNRQDPAKLLKILQNG